MCCFDWTAALQQKTYGYPQEKSTYFCLPRNGSLYVRLILMIVLLHLSQVKRTPEDSIYEFIIRKLNPLVVVDFRFISVFLHA